MLPLLVAIAPLFFFLIFYLKQDGAAPVDPFPDPGSLQEFRFQFSQLEKKIRYCKNMADLKTVYPHKIRHFRKTWYRSIGKLRVSAMTEQLWAAYLNQETALKYNHKAKR